MITKNDLITCVSSHDITIQFFTGRMPLLAPNQHRQSTEGTNHVI